VADARARNAGEPLYRRLAWSDSDATVESVRVNATVGDDDPEATVAAAREAVDDGFDCLKLKAGARSLTADLERVEGVREACPGAELRVDANGAWTAEVARRALGEFERLGVDYVEQPLPAGDLAGHAALREVTAVDVALDESLASATSVDRVLEAGAADVVVLKPMALGGVDRARAAARRARAAGLRAVVTTTIDAVHARTAAVHLVASLPEPPAAGLATGGLLAEDIAPDPCPVADGRMPVPQGKGNIPGPAGTGSA
jgi:o-succinylbenzoate synthase